jgi:hypothetical protein
MDCMPIDQTVVETARRLLAAHHPIGVADLAELLAKEGMHPPEGQDPLRWVFRHLNAVSQDRSVTCELPDMRLIDIDGLYEGLVLTHTLMATEINTGVVELEPDLIPLLLIDRLDDPEEGDDTYVMLAGGGRAELGRFFMPSDALGLAGLPGWLPDAGIGDTLAFRITNGELSVTRIGEPPPLVEDAAQALRSAYEQARQTGAEREGAVQVLDVFILALAEYPNLFRQPLPPLRLLLEAAGLEAKGTWVRGLADPAKADGVDELSVAALHIVLEVYRVFVLGRPTVFEELGLAPTMLARMLSVRLVAPTFASQMIQMGNEPLITAFARMLLDDHEWNAGPNLVLAMCAEVRGDALAGEALVTEALHADPCHADSLRHASWYAEDRGDAARALSYLRQAGVTDDPPQVQLLERFAAPGPATAAPRQPCPCGSGRVHEHCCAHRNGHPLYERAQWLYRKAVHYLLQPASQLAVLRIAEARTQGDTRPLAWMRAALTDPLTQDLGVFEGGLLEEFLDVRGVLLPADELALGRSWVGIRRGLYEVIAMNADDRRLRLRDLATGERFDVPAEAGIRYVPGLLLYARVAPDGRAQCMLDVLPVPANLGDQLLKLLRRDPGPVKIVTWFSAHSGAQHNGSS